MSNRIKLIFFVHTILLAKVNKNIGRTLKKQLLLRCTFPISYSWFFVILFQLFLNPILTKGASNFLVIDESGCIETVSSTNSVILDSSCKENEYYDRTEFSNSFTKNITSTIVDSDNNFAPDPSVAKGLDVITRTGMIGTTSYSYDIYDIDFSNSPTDSIVPNTAGNDINQLNKIDTESPVSQSGATGSGSWGFDTNTGQQSTRNALLFDFTNTPNNGGIGHFGIDLHDVESSAVGKLAEYRIYQNGKLSDSGVIDWGVGENGDGTSNFFGYTVYDTLDFFDQIVIVVGDEDENEVGLRERLAGDQVTFGLGFIDNKTVIDSTICQGDTIIFNNQSIYNAGTYRDTLQSNSTTCDSFIILTLTVNDTFQTQITAEICNGDFFNFNNQDLTIAGTYRDTLQAISTSCDSFIVLTLDVLDTSRTEISQTICLGQTYNFNAQDLNTTGVYLDTLQNNYGCDSILVLSLTLMDTFPTIITHKICQGETNNIEILSNWGSMIYTDFLWQENLADPSTSSGYALMNTTSAMVNIDATNASSGLINLLYTVTDNSGCSIVQRVSIEVVKAANSGTSDTLSICNAALPATLNLFNGLTGSPDLGGSWTETGILSAGVDLSNPQLVDFEYIPAGFYEFTYTVAGMTPCPNVNTTIVVEVTACFDLALRKTISSTGPFIQGDKVWYSLEIFNQGSVDAFDVKVTDYSPADLLFNPSENTSILSGNDNNWTVNGNYPTTTIDFIPKGSSVTLQILLQIDDDFSGSSIINNAEVVFGTNRNNSLIQPEDIDSTPGNNETDVAEIDTDNEIDNPLEEDDFDPAVINLTNLYARIIDPCNCLGNGLVKEKITIFSPFPNDRIVLTKNEGMYTPSSMDGNLAALPLSTVANYIGVEGKFYKYSIEFIHLVGIGYESQFSNELGLLSVSNVCNCNGLEIEIDGIPPPLDSLQDIIHTRSKTTIAESTLDYCDGVQYGNYTVHNLYVDTAACRTAQTICPTNKWQYLKLNFSDFDLAVGDTLCVFEGKDTIGVPIAKWSGAGVSQTGGWIAADCAPNINPSGCLTFLFKTNGDNKKGRGWRSTATCLQKDIELIAKDQHAKLDCTALYKIFTIKPAELITDCVSIQDSQIVTIYNDKNEVCIDTCLASNDSFIDTFAIGRYLVQYTLKSDSAKTAMAVLTVQGATLTCNDEVTIPLGASCGLTITPDDLLEGYCDTIPDSVYYHISIIGEDKNGQEKMLATGGGKGGNYPLITKEMIEQCGGRITATIEKRYYDGLDLPFCNNGLQQLSCSTIINILDQSPPVFQNTSTIDTFKLCITDLTPEGLGLSRPTAFDNCDSVAVQFLEATILSEDMSCDTTDIQVSWSATDACGNRTLLHQKIVILRPEIEDLIRVTNLILSCGEDEKSDLKNFDRTGFPGIKIGKIKNGLFEPTDTIPLDTANYICGYLAQYKDIQFPSDCGVKLIRSWSIIDWCDTDKQIIPLNTQFIEIKDTLAPRFVEQTLAPKSLELAPSDCTMDLTKLEEPLATDNCALPKVRLANIFRIEHNQKWEIPAAQWTALAADSFQVNWVAEDACHGQSKVDTLSQIILIEDKTKPSVICTDNIHLSLDNNIGVFHYSTIDAGSFDACGIHKYELSRDELFWDSIVIFSTQDIGNKEKIHLRATDKSGNQNTCWMTIDVKDNKERMSVNGIIKDWKQQTVESVQVISIGDKPNAVEMMTQEDGQYAFDLEKNQSYVIQPQKDIQLLNGVSTYDLVLMSKHILGSQLFDNPYQMIAADVNNSKTITTYDLVLTRKLILSIDNALTNNTSWRFIDANYEFQTTNPLTENFPEVAKISNLQHEMRMDFIAVKVGDVNGSARPNQLVETAQSRNGDIFKIFAEDRDLKAGEIYTVSFQTFQIQQISGYQFTLKFKDLVLNKINHGIAKAEHFGLHHIANGLLTTSWNYKIGSNQREIVNNSDIPAPLFSIEFTAFQDGKLSDQLTLAHQPTSIEAYLKTANNVAYNPMDIQLNYTSPSTKREFELYQNQPNPFINKTTIGFYLPEDSPIELRLRDGIGRTLKTIKVNKKAGYNTIDLEQKAQQNGFIYYQLWTKFGVKGKKMLKIN